MTTLSAIATNDANISSPGPPGTNPPDITPQNLDGTQSAITDVGQAFSICERMLFDNQTRITQLAQITRKWDGIEPPYSYAVLAEQGKTEFSNIPTGFLSSLIGRIAPRLVSRVESAPTITASCLPDEIDSGVEKSTLFQQAVTDTWRQWAKSSTFTESVSHEVSGYGRCFVMFDSPFSCTPKCYRTDRAFVPEGTEVGSQDVQVFCAQDNWFIHQAVDRIRNKQAAEEAGWDVEAMVDAINKAAPVAANAPGDVTKARTYADLVRDVVMGSSWQIGANVLQVWYLFATESNGSVTLWILSRDTKQRLFKANFPDMKMEDFVLPWTFQYGNGDFYGSYGVGQMVYELSAHVEKIRNGVVDNFNMRNKIFIHVEDPKNMNKASLQIQDKAIYITGGVPVGNTTAYPALAQEFEQLDSYMENLAQERVGAWLPEPQTAPGARPTATQAKINQLKEEETREFVTKRFLTQWLKLMWMYQKRLAKKGSPEEAAQAFQATVLAKMTEAELDMIVKRPAVKPDIDYSEIEKQQRIGVLQQIITTNDPYADQYEVRRQYLTLALDAGAAKSILIPQQDNTVAIEAQRQQQEEVSFMDNGLPINVSPRDNHLISMQFLKGQQDPRTGMMTGPLPHTINMAAALSQQGNAGESARLTGTATRLFNHYVQHFDFAAQNKSMGIQENDEKAFIAATGKMLQALVAHQQSQMQQGAQGATQTANGPLGSPGSPFESSPQLQQQPPAVAA